MQLDQSFKKLLTELLKSLHLEAFQRAICVMKLTKLILLVAIISLISCGPKTAERIRESPDQPQPEKRNYELLRPGLPMNTVKEAWGSPDSVEENCYRDECLIVWTYKGSPKVRYLFFKDGILVSWQ
jgi:hypothetical protein